MALSVLLFRHHIFGDGLYIGNPDRLNSNLKILKFHVDALAQGHLDAWSPFEMLGYDTFALPYTFPSVFTYLAFVLGPSNLYVAAGYEAAALLAASGAAAYAFLRIQVRKALPSLIGAILYQFSALSILKVSQNDLSFAVFILIPILLFLIKRIQFEEPRPSFIWLSISFFLLLHFMFLQKASYALILAGSYAILRSITARDWRILALVSVAGLVGLLGAFPRLFGIAVAIKQYSRVVSGLNFDNFVDVYQFQRNFPYQILRWFDGSLLGRFPSEGSVVLHNNVNLTEGFLLYTSSFVPFLILFGVLRYGGRLLGLAYSRKDDAAFFFWFLLFTFSVIVIPSVTNLIWLLYFKMDFTHARILIIGLLPLSVIVGLLLVDREPSRPSSLKVTAYLWFVAVLLALLMVFGTQRIADSYLGSTLVFFGDQDVHLRHSALVRIGLSAALVLLLMLGMSRVPFGRQGRYLSAPARLTIAQVAYRALALAVGLHTFINADFQINGLHTRAEPAFLAGDNYYSTKENFHPPAPDEIAAFKDRLDNDKYRAALVCDPKVAGGFCAGHIPEFWHLRVVDGYYGSGVPTRIATLPWRAGVSLRTISFTDPKELDWPILSLLNVRYAVKVSEAFYRNNQARPGEPWRSASVEDLNVIANPLPVVPRYFFAGAIEPVASASEATDRIFKGNELADVTAVSFVENIPQSRRFSGGEVISATGTGDHLQITVDQAASDRFLVANELFFPGWTATADGKPMEIYPANAVMRGVVVPAGTTKVELFYTPMVFRNMSLAFYGVASFLFVAGSFLFGRQTLAARR
jgi:hypothetical protein